MSPREVLQAWLEAVNVGDAEAVAALYHEDATNHQVADEPVVARDAIGEMLQRAFASVDVNCIPENMFEDGEWAILEMA